ncbi:DUF6630 family protein [Chitinophaga sp. RAB17]|uniref:DUF6630 family protein n=1 Tax=Chitinophaga sp. RAB17 TaxID=3233049 RepID=UPI003F92A93B
MHPKFISCFLTPTELPGLPVFNEDEQLLNFLIKAQYLTVTDWKGEDEAFQIGNFMKTRLNALSPGLALDIEGGYQLLHGRAGSLDTGDGIPFLLKAFQDLLLKEGFTIVQLDRGNDSYYIGLVFSRNLKDLKKQSSKFWRWKAFGELSGEVLYTVNCSCGGMNVWQVKRGEIITEDLCQDCGKEIFDKDGKSTFEVIREYI